MHVKSPGNSKVLLQMVPTDGVLRCVRDRLLRWLQLETWLEPVSRGLGTLFS